MKVYLRELGVHRVKVATMGKKDKKSAPGQNLYITFERKDGALIDATFSLPFNDFSKKAIESFMAACGVSGALSEIQKTNGKEVAIFVAPSPNPRGGDFWNVKGYYSTKYLSDEPLFPTNDVPADEAPPPGDDLPF